MAEEGEVIDNPAMHRFELQIGNEVATAYYALEHGRVVTQRGCLLPFPGRVKGPSSRTARSRGMRVIANAHSWPLTGPSIPSTS